MIDDCYDIKGGGRSLKSVKDKTREEYVIPNGITSISRKAFRDCTSMKRIVIPNTVTEVGEEAFKNCPSLRFIKLPEEIISIGKFCFADCKSLKEIIFPMKVESLGYACLDGCSNLEKVYLMSIHPETLRIDYLFDKLQCNMKCTLVVPWNLLFRYKEMPFAKQFSLIIQGTTSRPSDNIDKDCHYKKEDKIDEEFTIADLRERGWTWGLIQSSGLRPCRKDDNGIEYYLKYEVLSFEMNEVFKIKLKMRKQSWSEEELINVRGWDENLISRLLIPSFMEDYRFYLKTSVIKAEKSEEFQRFMNYINRNKLFSRGWTYSLINLFLPSPDWEFGNVAYFRINTVEQIERSERFRQLKECIPEEMLVARWSNVLVMLFRPEPLMVENNVRFYDKKEIERIEKCDKFIHTRDILLHGLQEKDLVKRRWPQCLIDHFEPIFTIKGNKYYAEGSVIEFEKTEAFCRIKEIIRKDCFSNIYLLKNGWTKFMIKHFIGAPDYIVGDDKYFKIKRIEIIRKNKEIQRYLNSRDNWRYLLGFLYSGNMNYDEFLEELVVNIPIFPKERLKELACSCFKPNGKYDKVPNKYDNDKNLAQLCMNYLRHHHTEYETILKTLGDVIHTRLKIKINQEIGKRYSWINRYTVGV